MAAERVIDAATFTRYDGSMAKKQRKRLTDEIREAMARSEKSRYAIARETDIDAASLSRFSQGRGLSMESLDRLAECLGLHICTESKANTDKKKGG